MVTWFDLMRDAQSKAGLETVARQYHISTIEAQRAMAAVMPAFAMGLQHKLAENDPARFFGGVAASPFAAFWQSTMRAFTPQAQQAGKIILDQMFGSDDVSRRVAHQAADMAGIGAETMQQMLPLFAGMFAGTLHQWLTNPERMAGAFNPTAADRPSDPTADWAQLWSSWLTTGAAPKKEPDNPFEAMMAPFLPRANERSPAQTDPWSQILGAGRDMQKQYFASLQSILEGSWQHSDKERQ